MRISSASPRVVAVFPQLRKNFIAAVDPNSAEPEDVPDPSIAPLQYTSAVMTPVVELRV